MKVIFSSSLPFSLAHGGVQTGIEAMMRHLPGLGVEVEPERWEDTGQTGDVLHYFGRPFSVLPVRLAHGKGRRVVMTEYLDETASRSRFRLSAQWLLTRVVRRALPGLTARMAWEVYRELDAMIYTTELEWRTARHLFDAHPGRGHIIPHGLEAAALESLRSPAASEDHLVSVATIHPRKNSVRLARAAREAGVPVVFLGKPYSEEGAYYAEFRSLVDDKCVIHPGFVSEEEKHRWLRESRGFVLGSEFESGCVAVYEAAAAGLPLLLANRPWARAGYPSGAELTWVEPRAERKLAAALRAFHKRSRRGGQMTFPVSSWSEIAARYRSVYETALSG